MLWCNKVTLAREAAVAGVGIAGLPLIISEKTVQNLRLIELLPDARLPVGKL